MAYQNLMAKREGKSLSGWLRLPEAGKREMAFTIPVMEASEISTFLVEQNAFRFKWLKIKVNKDLAAEMVTEVLRLFPGPVAIDGNEAWTEVEEVLNFQDRLELNRILFLEQPLSSAQRADYLRLKAKSKMEIWGDESVLHDAEPDFWKAAFDGINVKLMKAGSLGNAIRLLKTAKSNRLKTMIGCMVETSLGISAALSLESLADYMDLDGFLVIRNEPFGKVKEENGLVGLV